MSLGENTIYTWDDMNSIFVKKYHDFGKTSDLNDIIRMQQLDDESLEEYLECFLYHFHKSQGAHLEEKTVKTVFLKGLRDDCIETLNLLSGGDIYKKYFSKIAELCRTYSRSQAKVGRKLCDILRNTAPRHQKPASTIFTRVELGNLLEDFKTDILNTMGNQRDTMKHKKKQEDERAAMAIFCPRCRQKHMERECPINSIEVCGICALEHATGKSPSLPGL